MAEYKTDAQVNYGWGLSLEMTGKAPAIAKRIFATKADAQAYVDDANDSAIAGLQLSVVNDPTTANNGIYFVSKIGTGSEAGVLVKVGSDAEAELGALQSQVSGLESELAGKADAFTVGDGLKYASDKIDLVIDPKAAEILSVSTAGLNITIPEVPEYTLAVASTAANGALRSYELRKGNEKVGVSIDIPKDLVVSSGSVVLGSTITDGDYEADKLYLKLVIGNSDTPVYIAVDQLVDVYTAGAYLTLEGGEFSVNYTSLKAQIIKDVKSEVTDGIESDLSDLSATVSELEEKLGEDGEITSAIEELETSLSTVVKEVTVNNVDATVTSNKATVTIDASNVSINKDGTGATLIDGGSLKDNDSVKSALITLEQMFMWEEFE